LDPIISEISNKEIYWDGELGKCSKKGRRAIGGKEERKKEENRVLQSYLLFSPFLSVTLPFSPLFFPLLLALLLSTPKETPFSAAFTDGFSRKEKG
jgi:hypothetical protein